MNKRLSALPGFLPWGALFLAVSSYKAVQEYDSLFPFHGVTTKPKILVGLLIGGAIPYLTICLWEALAGLLFALILHRLPKFNRYLQGSLFYAPFHVLPLLPLFLYLRLNDEPRTATVLPFIRILILVLALGVAFIWIYARFESRYQR